MKTVCVPLITALLIIGLATPTQAAESAKPVPDDSARLELKNVPLREAIKTLARQAGVNYILDPSLMGRWRGKDGKPAEEPQITLQGQSLKPREALQKVLKDARLDMLENPATTVARIFPAGKHTDPKPVDPVTTSMMEKLPSISLENMGLLDAITRLAGQARLIPTLDSNISATSFEIIFEQPVSVSWDNLTPGQALAALFDNYGLLLDMGPDGKSSRIRLKPETEAEAQRLAAVRSGHAFASIGSWPEESLYHQLTSEPKSLKALNRVLKTPDEFSAAILYVSCSVALRLHRLEDAGFLFYAGQIRTDFDKALFPPMGSGGDSPLVALGVLQVEMGNRLSPALMSEPQLFARVAARVKSWKPRVPAGFEPGWDYAKKGNEKQAETVMAETRKEIVSQLGDLSMLLQDAAYFAAFKTAQDYNLKPADDNDRPTKAAYESACDRMEKIEKDKKIVGFAAAIKSSIARSDAGVPQR